MNYDYIEIETENVPYDFDIVLGDETFLIGVDYNETAEMFVLSLSKLNEETGEYNEICSGEPVVYGVPLWQDVYRSGQFPAVIIIPFDDSGESNAVTFDNFNKTVFLKIDNAEDDNELTE